jgi:hypothetical protein
MLKLDGKEFLALHLTYAEKEKALSGFDYLLEDFERKRDFFISPFFVHLRYLR